MVKVYTFHLLYLAMLFNVAYNVGPAALTFGMMGKIPDGKVWYKEIKPFCNSVEIDRALTVFPPPKDTQGNAYAIACYALAGKFDKVREKIDSSPNPQKRKIIDTLYNVALPIAKAGDNRSAGPIMEMVATYEPNYYMAQYYAGLSLYEGGKTFEAQTHFNRVLELYPKDPSMTDKVKGILKEIQKES